MKITKKVMKISHSLGIIIPKSITKKLKLKKGDYVEIDIKKSENGK